MMSSPACNHKGSLIGGQQVAGKNGRLDSTTRQSNLIRSLLARLAHAAGSPGESLRIASRPTGWLIYRTMSLLEAIFSLGNPESLCKVKEKMELNELCVCERDFRFGEWK